MSVSPSVPGVAQLGSVEKDWYLEATGEAGPCTELQRKYWISQGATGYSLGELETSWLKIVIAGLGETPMSNYASDLWKQLNKIRGYPVSNYINDNKLTYYLTETP
jgi:hypothetical protein